MDQDDVAIIINIMFFQFNIKPNIPIKNKNNDKFILLLYYKPCHHLLINHYRAS